eukprot:gnl/MRDRNA2_/MRDRNA2_161813_c0_seq1.p1 gnl/MRDRNA2_/MRDRNA2_161813_c0~~gnl/MRDRNA2_/MRDRNA2_161813_c0_seq1.p1  ORF type:complete len:517 (+),score=90.46 gnl/MRDRNA2_/MRDRNA2_161813_c0_seq1:40-1551(+)
MSFIAERTKTQVLQEERGKIQVSAATARKKTEGSNQPWTQKSQFQTAVGIVIAINAVTLGLEVDNAEEWKEVFTVFEHLFTFVFVVEMTTRWKVEGLIVYFTDPPSVLDFCLVMLSVVDVWIISPLGGQAGLRKVSLLRLLRLARLTRLLRLFKVFKELTIIATSFVTSGKTLFWGGIFLWIITYMFAIFATQQFGRATTCDDEERLLRRGDGSDSVQYSEDDPDLDTSCDLYQFERSIGTQYSLFGSLDRSMLTLYLCMTDGCGTDVISPITRRSPVMFAFWYLFVFITSFGIMNVMVGLFCENVMEGALESEKEFKKAHDEQRMERLELVEELFSLVDVDGDKSISREEYNRAIHEHPQVMALMSSLELDEEDNLFDQLDVDENGELTFEEFLNGTMMLMRGNAPAKGKDNLQTFLLSQSTHRRVMELTGANSSPNTPKSPLIRRNSDPYSEGIVKGMKDLSKRQSKLEEDMSSLHNKMDRLFVMLAGKSQEVCGGDSFMV